MTPDVSLGAFLRDAREAKGISLEQVASGTRIGVKILRSLEADEYADLPARPFIRGFVSAYCKFLGMDPREVLTRYGDFLEEKAQARPSKSSGHSGYAFERPDGENSRRTLWIVMGVILVLGGVGSVVLKPMLKRHKKTPVERARDAVAPTATVGLASPSPGPSEGVKVAVEVSPAPVVTVASPSPLAQVTPTHLATHTPSPSPSPTFQAPLRPLVWAIPTPSPSASPIAIVAIITPAPSPTATTVAAATPAPAPVPTATPTPTPSVSRRADPLSSGLDLLPDEVKQKVVIRVLDDVWVRFRVDAKPANRFVVRKDRILVLKAQDQVRFQASNPDAIRITINSQKAALFKDLPGVTTIDGDPTLYVPPLANGATDPSPIISKTGKLLGAPVPLPRGGTTPSTTGVNPSGTPSE